MGSIATFVMCFHVKEAALKQPSNSLFCNFLYIFSTIVKVSRAEYRVQQHLST